MRAFQQPLRITLVLSALAFATAAFSDEVINDDLIVTGNTCVGSDCVDGEDFSFLGIKIKNEEPQILFDDSSGPTFPANNWMIGITDNATSGAANFVIKDADADSNVLVLEPGMDGGVALGSGSELESNAVSVGAAGMERRIVHVAEGEDDTDAVNKAQLDSQFSSLSNSVDNRIDEINSELESQLSALSDSVDDRIEAIDARIGDLLNRINNL